MYENQRISDLVIMLEDCGWERQTTKRFYCELQKGDRVLTIIEEDGDYTLTCKNIIPDFKVIQLPLLTKIDVAALYHILEAYGILTMLALAKQHEIDVHDLINSSTMEVV